MSHLHRVFFITMLLSLMLGALGYAKLPYVYMSETDILIGAATGLGKDIDSRYNNVVLPTYGIEFPPAGGSALFLEAIPMQGQFSYVVGVHWMDPDYISGVTSYTDTTYTITSISGPGVNMAGSWMLTGREFGLLFYNAPLVSSGVSAGRFNAISVFVGESLFAYRSPSLMVDLFDARFNIGMMPSTVGFMLSSLVGFSF